MMKDVTMTITLEGMDVLRAALEAAAEDTRRWAEACVRLEALGVVGARNLGLPLRLPQTPVINVGAPVRRAICLEGDLP